MYKESRFVKGYMVLKIGRLLQTFYKILELYVLGPFLIIMKYHFYQQDNHMK